MMPRDDIEALQEEIKGLITSCGDWYNACIEARNGEFKAQQDCKILSEKLLSVKPELEDWLKTRFGEYL